MSGVPWEAEQREHPPPAPGNAELCSGCRDSPRHQESGLRGGLEGATGEVGGDGFQLRLERKGRELNLGAAIARAAETVLPSPGPAVWEGTDGPREILVSFEGLERLSAPQTPSFQEQPRC